MSEVTTAKSDNICLACGLCCNGVIFADVKLQQTENIARLLSLGLPLKEAAVRGGATGQSWKLPQPCQALEGCRCRIYSDRPLYCRQFDCALLKRVQKKGITPTKALRLIRQTHGQAETVLKLLRELGNAEESLALGERFRRITKQVGSTKLNPHAADLYSQLTLAFHDLTLTLSRFFYPGTDEE